MEAMNNHIGWRRLGAGHYTTTDGRWAVRSWMKNQWWLFKEGTLWGGWREERGWRRYEPFRTMREARAAVNVELHGSPGIRKSARDPNDSRKAPSLSLLNRLTPSRT
ncbi:hypothetical protein ETAA1_25500 [Urbifossiella limnaea]|uniref:Uncharacterized protein n=1 Tax=Urbifossiella limnaea TaxID=2528023 RepID=A0A517XSY3_9BACT|nr:hypothetical protein ETAA1_25500 [Urbifossiella limnaea]